METYFSEKKRLLIVDRIEAVARNHPGSELFPDCVSWQTVHVNLNIRSDLLVRQELTCNDLQTIDITLLATEVV